MADPRKPQGPATPGRRDDRPLEPKPTPPMVEPDRPKPGQLPTEPATKPSPKPSPAGTEPGPESETDDDLAEPEEGEEPVEKS